MVACHGTWVHPDRLRRTKSAEGIDWLVRRITRRNVKNQNLIMSRVGDIQFTDRVLADMMRGVQYRIACAGKVRLTDNRRCRFAISGAGHEKEQDAIGGFIRYQQSSRRIENQTIWKHHHGLASLRVRHPDESALAQRQVGL